MVRGLHSFKYVSGDESYPDISVEIEDGIDLDTILEVMTTYLRASGYNFDGNLIIENNDEQKLQLEYGQ